MNSIIKNQAGIIRELLDSTQDVGIIIGENLSIDTAGAALALHLVLIEAGKNVQIVTKNTPTVEISSLVGVDKIVKSFEGKTKILTISVPYREGEIEKVSYNIEGTKLNVNLFAEEGGIGFSEKEVEYIRKGSSPSLIITIGVTNDQELSGFVDASTVRTIHIDRNPLNPLAGDVVLIDPMFSSISEIVAGMIRELSFGFDPDAAQNLMDGITYATGNFTNPNTSAFAFEATGFLLQNGAKRKEKSLDRSDRSDRPQSQTSFDQSQGRQGRPFGQTQGKRDDRNRNFPRSDQFLNQRPPRVQNYNSQNSSQVPAKGWPTPTSQTSGSGTNQTPQPYRNPVPTPKEMTKSDVLDEVSDASFTEGSLPENIPEDWFLPKVFKGSKKGN